MQGKRPVAPPARCLLPAGIEGLNPVPGYGEEEGWGARWDAPASFGMHWAALGTLGMGGRSVRLRSPTDEQGCNGASAGSGEKSWLTSESRVPISPCAGKPAVYGIAVQAGRVCLQRFARQREPERGGHGHPRDHEQEPHRWVTGGLGGGTGSAFAPAAPGVPELLVGMGSVGLGWQSPLPSLARAAGSGRARPGRTGIPRDAGQPLACPEIPILTRLFWRDGPTCFISVFPWGICFPSKLESRGGFCCGFASSLLP